MKVLRTALIVAGVIVALTIGASLYGWRGMNGSYAQVDLAGYTEPMRVAVTVSDSSGNPVTGASIMSESFSGTTSPVFTDAKGFAAIEPGETEVLALHVDGREVWISPYKDGFILKLFFLPSCAGGLSFNVTLKANRAGAGFDPASPITRHAGGSAEISSIDRFDKSPPPAAPRSRPESRIKKPPRDFKASRHDRRVAGTRGGRAVRGRSGCRRGRAA